MTVLLLSSGFDCSFILDITKYQSSPSYGILVDAFKAEWTANINKSSYLFINIKPLSVKVQMYDQFTAIKSLLLSIIKNAFFKARIICSFAFVAPTK